MPLCSAARYCHTLNGATLPLLDHRFTVLQVELSKSSVGAELPKTEHAAWTYKMVDTTQKDCFEQLSVPARVTEMGVRYTEFVSTFIIAIPLSTSRLHFFPGKL